MWQQLLGLELQLNCFLEKGEVPFSVSPLYKEVFGFIIPGVQGLIIPRTEKGVAQIGSVLCPKGLLTGPGKWSYGSRFSPSGASDQGSLIQ